MAQQVKPVPDGYHTVTPYLVVDDAEKAIEFYKKAFNATELHRMKGPEGKILHAEVKIGDSIIMMSDESPGGTCRSARNLGGTPVRQMLYVVDVDAVFRQAVKAGAKPTMQPADMFWGDRYGRLVDPFGHEWDIATHKEDLKPEEIRERQEEFFAKMAAKS